MLSGILSTWSQYVCGSKTVSIQKRVSQSAIPSGMRYRAFIVDEDEATALHMGQALDCLGCDCAVFADSALCLAALSRQHCDLLVVGMVQPGIETMGFVRNIRSIRPNLAVIVVAGNSSIEAAVAAIKSGACHFVEKPLDTTVLQNAVLSVLSKIDPRWEMMPESLTASQKTVLGWVLRGYSNSQIAAILGKSVRTIEDQRSGMMAKLGVESIVDLVKLCADHGIIRITPLNHVGARSGQ